LIQLFNCRSNTEEHLAPAELTLDEPVEPLVIHDDDDAVDDESDEIELPAAVLKDFDDASKSICLTFNEHRY
jgi:hypothetical protein